ncbi:hypothetical protein CPC08DRAFT_246333 [Agrocybe pediades]|nr:hypothetical protein CPC08DRAFT_246333 [Agrocybe pediades]
MSPSTTLQVSALTALSKRLLARWVSLSVESIRRQWLLQVLHPFLKSGLSSAPTLLTPTPTAVARITAKHPSSFHTKRRNPGEAMPSLSSWSSSRTYPPQKVEHAFSFKDSSSRAPASWSSGRFYRGICTHSSDESFKFLAKQEMTRRCQSITTPRVQVQPEIGWTPMNKAECNCLSSQPGPSRAKGGDEDSDIKMDMEGQDHAVDDGHRN